MSDRPTKLSNVPDLYAWMKETPDGTWEPFFSSRSGLPLIGSEARMIAEIPVAQAKADALEKPVRLVKYVAVEQVKVIEPRKL